MPLDLRIPIGLLFSLLGLALGLYGLTADRAVYGVSLGINVNAWWGGAMLAFGAAMLVSARVAARRRSSDPR
jgi:hypothetical protein